MWEFDTEVQQKINHGSQWGEPTPEEEAAWEFLEQKIKNQANRIQVQDQK